MTLILLFAIIYITNISDALVCYQCSNPSTSSNPLLKYFCEGPNDLGKLKTCKEGDVCTKKIYELPGVKIYIARFCDPDPVDFLVGKCHFDDQEGGSVHTCMCKTDKCNSGSGASIDNGNGNGNGNGKSQATFNQIIQMRDFH